ncbi:AsmA-like C-terminal region-containing protein [Marinobacterium aestuariivivens]|uniref:AsmA-like C-terminal region-containing protein n=1 Tax=Marinobacterium aestuariivivens TaxID=1698799 RepID=A0ABW1ZWE6_9GAMM
MRELDLEIGALNVGGNRFEQLRVQLAPSPWRLAVSNPQLDGRLEWPAGSGQPYRLLLERLQLPRPEGSGKAEAAPPQDDPEPIDIGSLPPVDIRIASLRLGDEAFGSWQLGLRPAGSRMRFEGLEGRVGGLSIRGEGVWQEQPASTELTLRLQGDDLGDLLSAWGNGRVLESERAEGYLQLAWPQRPWNFALARSRGELQFALEDGRIIDSGSASNVLRLFGILNLNSLARRLKLDFSDLLQSGLAFDRLSGRYGLERGWRAPLSRCGSRAFGQYDHDRAAGCRR